MVASRNRPRRTWPRSNESGRSSRPSWRWPTSRSASGVPWARRPSWTGTAYSWFLPRHRELPGLRAALAQIAPTVRVESTRRGVIAFVATEDYVDGWASYVLAEASPLGRGDGWEVRDRPSGGELARLKVPGKAE